MVKLLSSSFSVKTYVDCPFPPFGFAVGLPPSARDSRISCTKLTSFLPTASSAERALAAASSPKPYKTRNFGSSRSSADATSLRAQVDSSAVEQSRSRTPSGHPMPNPSSTATVSSLTDSSFAIAFVRSLAPAAISISLASVVTISLVGVGAMSLNSFFLGCHALP